MEMDAVLYDKCARENADKIRIKEAEREASAANWAVLIAAAATKGVHVAL